MRQAYKAAVAILAVALLLTAIAGVITSMPQLYIPTQHFYGQVVGVYGNQAWVDLVYLPENYSQNLTMVWHECRQDFPLLNSHLTNGTFVFFDANSNWIDYHFYTIRATNVSATQLAYQLGSECMAP